MRAALEQARLAASKDEVPIGAVVMRGDEIIAEAHNETVARRNPTYHAEFLVIERALEALETDRLTDCTLYVTMEPCAQCAGRSYSPRSESSYSARTTRRQGCADRWGIWSGIRD